MVEKCLMHRLSHVILVLLALGFSGTTLGKDFVIAAPADARYGSAMVDVVVSSYQRLGLGVELRFLPPKRALLSAQHDENCDGELARIREAEHALPDLVRVPVALAEMQVKVVALKDTPKLRSVDQLSQYHLSGIRGIVFTDRLLPNYMVTYANDILHAVDLLKAKRVDLLLVPNSFADPISAGHPKVDHESLVVYSAPIPAQKLYHYVHKRHIYLIPDLALAISEVSGFPVESSAW